MIFYELLIGIFPIVKHGFFSLNFQTENIYHNKLLCIFHQMKENTSADILYFFINKNKIPCVVLLNPFL